MRLADAELRGSLRGDKKITRSGRGRARRHELILFDRKTKTLEISYGFSASERRTKRFGAAAAAARG